MANEEQFDGVLLGLAQQITQAQGPGIDPLLNTFLGFLRRKTDFFTGANPEQVEAAMLKSVRLQLSIAEKEKAEKEKARKKQAEKKAAESAKKKESAPVKAKTADGRDTGVEIEILNDEDQVENEPKANSNTKEVKQKQKPAKKRRRK
mmetsp:Transcript_20763/g.25150  ORF Transcript_20763/g.25150 Transcript_20763/m.25150 type:complete len:148 (+) Transcript_20763:145-588(+)